MLNSETNCLIVFTCLLILAIIIIILLCVFLDSPTEYVSSKGKDDSPSSSSSSSSSSEQAIDITADELLTKLNKGELNDGEIYQFTGVPFEPDNWGMNADETHYTINVKAFDEINKSDNDLLLFTTKEVANKIKNSSNIKFKVKVSNAEDGGDLNVLSAIPS